jgi:hypothetical protein
LKSIYYDYWIERLIRLRRIHLEQRQAHSLLEIQYRLELTQQYQRERSFYASHFERALLIQRQADRIVEYTEAKVCRREALRKHQAEETYNLLRLKMGAVTNLVAFAPYHDQ